MHRLLVSLLCAFVLVTGCSQEAGRILAPESSAAPVAPRDRVLREVIPREDSIFAGDFANDIQLASAGSIIVAAGSMDYSFTLRFRRFVGPACTGSAESFMNVFGVSDFGFSIDLGTGLSVEIEAAATANDGTPFHRWQGPLGFVSGSRTLCVDVPAGVDTYTAFFEASAGNTAPTLAAIGSKTVDELQSLQFVATASDSDVPAQSLVFGLRNGSAGMIPQGAVIDASGAFSWTPSEDQGPGVFTFDVCVTDNGVPPLDDCETISVTVLESNSPPSIGSPGPFVVDEGTTLTFTAAASDPDLPSNALSFALEGAPAGASIDAATGAFSWTPLDDAGSPFTFGVVVTDEAGASAHADVTVTVNNVAPMLSALSGLPIAPVPVGLVHLSGSFADPSPVDVHDLEINCNYGGNAIPGSASVGSNRNWTGECNYAAPGIYRVRVQVRDDEGDSSEAVSDPVIVYDPEGGFITGGGWFDSPPGAYPAAPSFAGRAHFGFVSKYVRGAPSPGGNTEFMLKDAGLQFRSTSYDWLVVAGSTAQFRGAGELNGQPGYRFEINAMDGGSKNGGDDRIRVRIWHESSGLVIYDNGLSAGIGPASASSVVSGSIVIHDGKTSSSQAAARR